LAFSACISFVSIFLFKNRMLQVKATILNLLLSIVIGYFVFRTSTANPTGGFTIYSIALFAMPILQILAIVKIYKDERLVKSADRLR
jgi:L-lactate permease